MKPLLESLRQEIIAWFDNLSKQDLQDIEDGKPFHLTCGEKGKLMRAIFFFERYEI